MSPKTLCLFMVIVVCITMTGCGNGKKISKTHTVRGVVTVDGSPAIDASVSFALKLGQPITGTTDETGSYTLNISQAMNSCIPGPATVSIEAFTRLGDPRSQFLPKRYNKEAAQNPEMRVELKSGKNELNFALSSQ